MNRYLRIAIVVLGLAGAVSLGHPLFADQDHHWVGTWNAAMHPPNPGPPGLTNPGFSNQTLRQIVHTSVGGSGVRVRLSTLGAAALEIGAAHVAIREANAAIMPGTSRPLTFGGQPSLTIPPGAVVLSDAVDLDVPALSDLAVSIYVPGMTGPTTWHFVAQQTSFVSPAGDFSDALDMPVSATTQAWFWLTAVEVLVPKQVQAVAAFGDSVTDGVRSTLDANKRWPDYLAGRLLALERNRHMGVLNAAITGNRLLHDGIGHNAVARFERDVLAQAGITHVIVLLGNNDITLGAFLPGEIVTSAEIIQAHRMLISRGHARGLALYGATLPPFMGVVPAGMFSELDAKRRAVNEWIRSSGAYDAVIDFDEVLRDPSDDRRLLPLYDSGDHLHPNDTGYEAMGRAVDLALFDRGRGQPR